MVSQKKKKEEWKRNRRGGRRVQTTGRANFVGGDGDNGGETISGQIASEVHAIVDDTMGGQFAGEVRFNNFNTSFAILILFFPCSVHIFCSGSRFNVMVFRYLPGQHYRDRPFYKEAIMSMVQSLQIVASTALIQLGMDEKPHSVYSSSVVPNLSGTMWNVRPNLSPQPSIDLSFADGATMMEPLDGANNSMTPVNLAVVFFSNQLLHLWGLQ
uniref:Uncharacterized protein n=1 Tax=Quercus lobata TaxID=97700 RepID=A0A7N2L251_QUELO